MRFLIYAKAFYPSIGGMEVSTRNMSQALVALGHEVSVFTETRLGSKKEINEGYEIIRSNSYFLLLWHCLWSDRIIIRGGVSAVAGAFAWVLRVPLCIVHELYGPFVHGGNSLKVLIGNYLRKKIVLAADTHLAVSQAVLNAKDLPLSSYLRVLYNPCEFDASIADTINSKDIDKDIDILFVGRLIEGKGINVLMDSLRLFDISGTAISAVIVGDGPELQAAKNGCGQLPKVSVLFVGSVSREVIPRYYSRSKLLVIPTTSHPEGMGIVIAEAFAFGLPVLGSDLPAIREVVGDAGILIPPGNAIWLKDAILNMLNDKLYYDSLAQKAKKRSELFSLKLFYSNIKDVVDYWYEKDCQ